MDRKLFHRELNGNTGFSSVNSLYGSRAWVENLDIVNELQGHTGCVNAVSWSRNGALLASGSDDTQINIHTTTPEFALNTRIDTGHTENIFSVKFMPHSDDRTIISAAGDGEVRIFDIEYAPTSSATNSSRSSSARMSSGQTHPRLIGYRRRGVHTPEVTPQKLYSHYENLNHKVYRSHTDRVKRIVTESSPHVFLTCSEDGTVRQFDLRQPSDFYSRPSRSSAQRTYFGVTLSSMVSSEEDDNRNPPLISYKRHQIDLNTVSCSTSQPHYIALGGAHLHCFLHDRRMLGRDLGKEAGAGASTSDNDLSAATRCVRRFAPLPAKSREYRTSPHITACKISDANPNDVVVSWSGGGIYLFDINRSPAPNEKGIGREPWNQSENSTRTRCDRNRRCRGGEPRSKRRRAESSSDEDSEDSDYLSVGHEIIRIPALLVELRKEIFGLNSSEIPISGVHSALEPEEVEREKKKSWDEALRTAQVLLKRIDREIKTLERKDLEFFDKNEGRTDMDFGSERTLRRTCARNRRRTRAFVKAAGCLARALGGFVEGIGLGVGIFIQVGTERPENSSFRYRFLQIIISFLDGGSTAVEELIKEDQDSEDEENDSDPGDIGRFLDALEREARNNIVRDVDTNEEIFDSEKAMVKAFKAALDLGHDEIMAGSDEDTTRGRSIRRFWGQRVGRSLLMQEGDGVDFAFVDSAFGGFEGEGDSEDEIGGLNLELEADEDQDEEGGGEGDEEEHSEEDGEYGPGSGREGVEIQAPVWEHTKFYSGHCNVKTVKDVNFYGMDDEYVVSGSDCGNLFIWDRKTTQIVNILRGDDEIVNVITGHPYEPKLAVSGIDYTVKIFSPDESAQREFQGLSLNDDEEEPEAGRRLNESRKRIQNEYSIRCQNQVMTESGLQEAVHAVRMLSLSFDEWLNLYTA
ncbi:uncharacterized protein H6S33_009342 [Morchella sextelata]|uniref:uncharacterized protein n=1 Tax=Morchella sextelata TaxID=1174677 RepID=UPI001D036483|nr:uncharacterized protein H6S33_009342 [Morchella sextelata]KAH0612962.1 hypothetical protein H6S33_009342 [Morchella sextelata]